MLSKINRLTKKRDFNLLLKYGMWTSGQLFRIKWLKLDKNAIYFPKKEDVDKFKKQLKLAVVVGLKVDKRAVVRNRIKRQAREVLRLMIKNNRLQTGYYLMVVAQKSAISVSFAEISKEIELLLNKIRLIK